MPYTIPLMLRRLSHYASGLDQWCSSPITVTKDSSETLCPSSCSQLAQHFMEANQQADALTSKVRSLSVTVESNMGILDGHMKSYERFVREAEDEQVCPPTQGRSCLCVEVSRLRTTFLQSIQ